MARVWLFVLWSCSALAGERVRVAVHPLGAPGVDDPKLIIELDREVANILAETQRLTLAAPEDVQKRLAEEGGRCAPRGKERIDCLERLALATRTTYVLAVTVKRLGKDYELSATIADSDRVPLEQPELVMVNDSGAVKIEVALKHQLKVLLLEKVKAADLPVDPRKRNPAEAAVTNPPPANPLPPAEPVKPPPGGMSTMRMLAFGAGGVAVISAVACLILGVLASGEASTLMVDMNGELKDASQVTLAKSSIAKSLGATITGGFAAAAAVAAIMMFVLSPAEEPVATLAPVALSGGAGAVLTWRLP